MEKTITINLGGNVIRIASAAWLKHLAYIETLHCYFKNEEGGFEIINDIENRMNELMWGIMHTKCTCLDENDIDRIIKIMGTVDEFKELDADDWEISIVSTEHCNTNAIATAISFFGKSKLCYN